MGSPSSVAIHTLGCKLNFSESSTIRQRFEDRGFAVHPFDEVADVYVINTCSVTEFADRKCRSAVRKALRQNAEARVVVIGCYAQLKPQEIADIPGVDLVLGAAEKFRVVDYVDTLGQQPGKGLIKNDDIHTVNSFEEAFSFGDRTRSFLKIQDGCDYNCSFCTIPLARGKSRSGEPDRILEQIRDLETRGVSEVVLTGVNIGDYGKGIEQASDFLELIKLIDAESSIPRFRISSIEPNLTSAEIISFVAGSQRFMPHFHMPLQSGSNAMLARMRRRYRRELYGERVNCIRQVMPHACIGADVIVGFPGETEEHFMETVDFIDSLSLSYLHVFTYSSRANTPSAEMPEQVPVRERRRRNKILTELSHKKRRHFYQQHIGTARPVLFEPVDGTGAQHGFTDNYIKVKMNSAKELTNEIWPIDLQDIDEVELKVKGRLQKENPAVRLTAMG